LLPSQTTVKESDPVSEEVFVALPQVVGRKSRKRRRMLDKNKPPVLIVMRFIGMPSLVYTVSVR